MFTVVLIKYERRAGARGMRSWIPIEETTVELVSPPFAGMIISHNGAYWKVQEVVVGVESVRFTAYASAVYSEIPNFDSFR